MVAAKKLIGIFDVVQEHRTLSDEEIQLKMGLKQKLLGLAAVEKLRLRQQSRLTWLKANDTNSQLFFLSVNGRKRKNHIQTLQTAAGQAHTHKEKAQALHEHFNSVLGALDHRESTLNWERVGIQRHNLQHLEAPFIEEEIHRVIMAMPGEKAPGPDGYIGVFFKTTWDIVKQDIIAAINLFFNQQTSAELPQLWPYCTNTKAC